MSITTEEIVEEFLDFDIQVKDDVLSKLEDIATLFKLSAVDLVNEWVAYQSRNEQRPLTYTELEHLERELTNTRTKASLKKSNLESVDNNLSFVPVDSNNAIENIIEGYCSPGNKGKLENLHVKTPLRINNKAQNNALSPSVFSPISKSKAESPKYVNRSNAGEVVFSLIDSDDYKFSFPTNVMKRSCKVVASLQNVSSNYRYMFQKTIDVCDILNDAIESAADSILEEHSENIESFAPCSVPSQGEVVTVGRIASENMARLTPISIMLEGDRMHSFGRSVNVEISQLEDCSFFSGQILAIRGVNPSGNKFVASHLHTTTCNDGRITIGSPNDFNAEKSVTSFIIAVGPFTTSDSLNYSPLTDLLEIVKQDRPDVTVLLGPILDCNHFNIQNGKVTEFVFDLADQYIKSIKNDLNFYTEVVFVPSLNDIFHHPVYPQPPYEQRSSERVHYMSNPCMFQANDLNIGATSVDVLFHLCSEEISKSSTGSSDRLSRLLQHLLNQSSFYPLYPPHESVPLDVPSFEFGCKLPSELDVLIVPSDLRSFVKCLQGRLCINPGRLAKGLGGGTYARVLINSEKKATAQIVRI